MGKIMDFIVAFFVSSTSFPMHSFAMIQPVRVIFLTVHPVDHSGLLKETQEQECKNVETNQND